MAYGETTSEREEQVDVVDAAYRVHKEPGPGLLESVYEACLAQERISRGPEVRRQVKIPVVYRGISIDEGCRMDLLIEESVIAEIKAVQEIHPVCRQQIKTYLRVANLQLGCLMNFNVPLIKDGIERIICTRKTPSS